MATADENFAVSEHDVHLARELSRLLDQEVHRGEALEVHVSRAGEASGPVLLPERAAILLRDLLKEMAAGRAVAVVPVEAEITTQQAAEILNVSRPFVVGLIEKGALPARMVGTHRRVRLEDLLAYKAESRKRAKAAFSEMVAISQELGLE